MCNHPINKTCTNCGEQFCVRCNPGAVCPECEKTILNFFDDKKTPSGDQDVLKDYPIFLNFERADK